MEGKGKIFVINLILIIMLVMSFMLGALLIMLSISKAKVERIGKSGSEISNSYATTEETVNSNTWDVSANGDGSVMATLLDEGTLTISGTGKMKHWDSSDTTDWHGMKDSVNAIIIESGIMDIGNDAFSGCTNLMSVEIPNTVERIGLFAFAGCKSLNNIGIPISVKSIGTGAFRGCTSLVNIKISNSITIIENSTFAYCDSLINIEIPDGITSIGSGAFSGCTSLVDIKIPNSVKCIESRAFDNCKSLEKIKLSSSLISIGKGTFFQCYSISNIEIPDNVENIGDEVFYGCKNLQTIEIPSSVKSIGTDAFGSCTNLINIEVDESNTNYIDYNGVLYTKNGTKIIKYPQGKEEREYIILESVTTIANGAFKGSTNLEKIEISSSVTSIGAEAFMFCINLTNVEIPTGVTSIGDWGFSYCYSLTEVEIADSVINIRDYAFLGCENLVSIEIPSNVISIGENVFSSCNRLKEVKILSSITSMGNYAFSDCKSLVDVEIPSSVVSSMGDYVFNHSQITNFLEKGINTIELPDILKIFQEENAEFELTNCTIEDNNININDKEPFATIEIKSGLLQGLTYVISYTSWDISNAEDNSLMAGLDENGLFTIYGVGDMKIYKKGLPWGKIKQFIRSIKIEEGVTSVYLLYFNYCDYLENIEIPGSLTNIKYEEYFILYNCNSLVNISVDSNNTKYCDDDGVLYTKDKDEIIKYPAAKKEKEYKISSNVKIISDVAFMQCDNLISVVIPNSVTTIDNYAFDGCNNLTICCKKDSTAHTYAAKNEIDYLLIMDRIQPKTTVKQMEQEIGSASEYKIIDKNGEIITDVAYVTTGCKVETNDGENYIIIVIGDCNGDGQADIKDILSINKHRLNIVSLTMESSLAGDVNVDGQADMRDIFQINKFRLEKISEL